MNPLSEPPLPSPEHEVGRARARRVALGIVRPRPGSGSGHETGPGDPAPASSDGGPPALEGRGDHGAHHGAHHGVQWALALSGGGIRSATFCLGVMQALAKIESPVPGPARHPGDDADAGAGAGRAWPLLAQFDFLSTVSGGGYIGGFFSSLFVRGRLSGKPDETALESTERAYAAMREEPPGRIHREANYDANHPGRTALAWLRDNGRYMAPGGAGDLLYGITIAIRNWFATQYVVATVIMVVLSALLAGRWLLAGSCPWYRDWEHTLLNQALITHTMLWWSPSWGLCGLLILVAALPLGIAYWYSHPAAGKGLSAQAAEQRHRQAQGHAGPAAPASASASAGDSLKDHLATPPEYVTVASALGLLLAVCLGALGWVVCQRLQRPTLGSILLALGASVLLSIVWYLVATWRTRASRQASITLLRVLLTRWLTRATQCLLVLAGLATIETLAQTAWLWLSFQHAALLSGLMALAVWLMRRSAQGMDDKGPGKARSRVPIGLLAGIVGGLLWMVVAVGLDILLLQVVWPEGRANPQLLWSAPGTHLPLGYAAATLALALLMAWIVGHFPGFLNLSTLQSLYSARIIRAYLGASNHARFAPGTAAKARDVAEPIKGDSLSVDDIHRNPLAPIHFVNVCVNQSVSPGEQLIQRDRKGKPLVVGPGGIYFDRHAHPMTPGSAKSELWFPLSFGEWLGVSGAAFSTGLGRGTGLGMSLAMGFANVRLGRWWKGLPDSHDMQERWYQKLFPTQSYLLDELRGKFYGNHRPYLYLSDGGHFENLAIYELLRPDRPRDIRMIVACDCGCDPDYQFEDLANLIRLVRIDHGLEIRTNQSACCDKLLQDVFACPADFLRGADGHLPARHGRCAILLDVVGTERSAPHGIQPGMLWARILLIKPSLLKDISTDIAHYQTGHMCFPQETTMDQFFDEAQWESYRQLGLRVAERVFTGDGSADYAERLWTTCLDGLPA